MDTPTFTNGFQNYLETFFHLTCLIQDNYNENWNNNSMTAVKVAQGFGGHMALCELAKKWTEEFERIHEGETWEEYDWYDTLEAFFTSKNQGAGATANA